MEDSKRESVGTKGQQSQQIKVALANIRSLRGKIDEVEVLSTQYDVICLTETQIDSSISNGEILDCKVKTIHRKDRKLGGGGVLIAVDTKVTHTRVELNLPLEVVAINISRNQYRLRDLILVCLYKPPNMVESIEAFETVFQFFSSKYFSADVVYFGDFNMPDIEWKECKVKESSTRKNYHQSFLDVLSFFGLQQFQLNPSHIKGNVLDLVITSSPNVINSVEVIEPGPSDHYLVETYLDFIFRHQPFSYHEVRQYEKADREKIETDLILTNQKLSSLVESRASIDNVWRTFRDDLASTIHSNIPTKAIKSKSAHEPLWFNRKARKLVQEQRSLYNKAKKLGGTEEWEKYDIFRKATKKELRRIKRSFMEAMLYEPLKLGNSKPFYKLLKKKREQSSGIGLLKDANGEVLESPQDKANLLNEYFSTVFSPVNSFGNEIFSASTSDYSLKVCPAGVKKLIDDLPSGKAPGPDGLRKEDLSVHTESISECLAVIFNYSLQTGAIPSEWKLANVVPIFKKGDRLSPSNYRPVSLTCIACKLLEHIVLHEINPLLENQLAVQQHGFRKGFSCDTQLATTLTDITYKVDRSKIIHAAVLDFSKAFDKVDHFLLIQKLQSFDIPTQLITWIRSFLSDRTQQVLLDGAVSKQIPVTSGVPQGSVLGPKLFLVFINDITTVIHKDSNIRLFADDALLYKSVGQNKVDRVLQEDLNSLADWAEKQSMQFNPKKCSIITFPQQECADLNYSFCGDNLHVVTATPYLGVTIQSNLKWGIHIQNKVSKCYQILGLIRRVLKDGPPKVKLQAYITLCRPILEYGSIVWDPYKVGEVQIIERVQNRAIRIIYHMGRQSSVSSARKSLGLELLESRRRKTRMKLLLQALSSPDHPLADLVSDITYQPHANTRSSAQLLPTSLKTYTNTFHHSFLPRTIRDLRGVTDLET